MDMTFITYDSLSILYLYWFIATTYSYPYPHPIRSHNPVFVPISYPLPKATPQFAFLPNSYIPNCLLNRAFHLSSHRHPTRPSPSLRAPAHTFQAHPAQNPIAAAPRQATTTGIARAAGDRRGPGPAAGQLLQRHLGGILFGVADVLPVVPEARLH